jgi:hypothetical protein
MSQSGDFHDEGGSPTRGRRGRRFIDVKPLLMRRRKRVQGGPPPEEEHADDAISVVENPSDEITDDGVFVVDGATDVERKPNRPHRIK